MLTYNQQPAHPPLLYCAYSILGSSALLPFSCLTTTSPFPSADFLPPDVPEPLSKLTDGQGSGAGIVREEREGEKEKTNQSRHKDLTVLSLTTSNSSSSESILGTPEGLPSRGSKTTTAESPSPDHPSVNLRFHRRQCSGNEM